MSKPNPMTSPCKKGGPGYVDICINEYPEHVKDPYGPPPIKKGKKARPRLIPFYSGFAPSYYFYENPYYDEKDDPPRKPTYINREKSEKPKTLKPIFIPPSPAKKQGNNHDGCFDTFPEHMKEPYIIKPKKRPKSRNMPFIPTFSQEKTMNNPSVLISTEFQMNGLNWKTYGTKYVKYL